MSIAGGYWKAVEAAAIVESQCVQIFTKNNNRWKGKTLTEEDCERFKSSLQQHGIEHTLSHASYLINLASNKPELLEKSIIKQNRLYLNAAKNIERITPDLKELTRKAGIPWPFTHDLVDELSKEIKP